MATKRIKSQHPKSQGPFVIIEAEDFDPKKHEEYLTPEQQAEADAAKKQAEADAAKKQAEADAAKGKK